MSKFKFERLVDGNWNLVSQHNSFADASTAYFGACGTDLEFKLWYLDNEGKMQETHQTPGRMNPDIRICCPAGY